MAGTSRTSIRAPPSRCVFRELDLVATNIRNRPRKRPYPSDVRFSAVVFESGRLSAEGQANFLAEPNPTFRGDVELTNVELDYFKPITNRYNLSVDKGTLSATGHVEYGLEVKTVSLTRATIDGIHVDYVHTAPTAGAEQRDTWKGGRRGQAGQQRARPARADQRAPAHAEHGRVRQQSDVAVVPRVPQPTPTGPWRI